MSPPNYNTPEVRDLLFRLLRAPEGEQEALRAAARERCSEVAAVAEQALAEVMALLDRLPDDPEQCRATLATGPTLHPLIGEAIESLLPGTTGVFTVLDPLSAVQIQELLPTYSPEMGPGTLFRYYLIERELSRGGMGVVYIARDTRFRDRPVVALKVLLQIEPTRMDWFRDEASMLYELAQDANVVGIRDYGTEPAPFIAMELVEGGSLAQALESKTWPPRDQPRPHAAAQLARTLARTLEEALAHHGIVHLDLKPANVLLHPRRGPLLADFSLSRRVAGGEDRLAILGGTPAYSAPEQAGQHANARAASVDIYGVGAILYELLTGRPPFVLGHGESFTSFLQRIQTEEPPPPHALVAGIPADLEAICLRCLRKEPRDRYRSVGELADDLEAFLRGDRPRVARWPWHRTARRIVRRRWVGLSLSALSIACVASLLLLFWSRAEAAFDQARRERAHHRQQILASARAARDQGDWQLAMELYDTTIRDPSLDAAERLILEVERLPGWFLYRPREDVAAELDRLEAVPNLPARERARIQLCRADLRMCMEGRTPAVLASLREALAFGVLDRSDVLYAEALVSPTSRAALAKLRELVQKHPGHYRGRASLLVLLFVRGELEELREGLRLHEDRFRGDPIVALLKAELDILQKDDLPSALTHIDKARARLGEERWKRCRAFLAEWAKLLRSVSTGDAPDAIALLRLKTLAGGDKDVFSLNVPTICWLWEHWGAAVNAFAASAVGLLLGPDGVLEKWQAVCEDSPEVMFAVNRVMWEMMAVMREEKQGRKEQALARVRRTADLAYQAADPHSPTLLPRSDWRYQGLLNALLADVAYLAASDRAMEPELQRRLRDGLRRAVTEGNQHRKTRTERLPHVVGHLTSLARQRPKMVPPETASVVLVDWMQEDADNPVPYRLRAKLALDLDQPVTAWAVVVLWYADKRRPKDAQLDDLARKAKEGVGRLLQVAAQRAD